MGWMEAARGGAEGGGDEDEALERHSNRRLENEARLLLVIVDLISAAQSRLQGVGRGAERSILCMSSWR